MSLYLSVSSLLLWTALTNRGNTNCWGDIFVHRSSLWKREFARMRKRSRHSKDATRPMQGSIDQWIWTFCICTYTFARWNKHTMDVCSLKIRFLLKVMACPFFFGGSGGCYMKDWAMRDFFLKLAYNIF